MTSWTEGTNEEHRRLRELLGSYALGHLDEVDAARVRAHLDGCAACSADLAEIGPLAGLLATVDSRTLRPTGFPSGRPRCGHQGTGGR